MPSHFALLNEIRFDRIAGLIPHGHFDHDAACITGPRFEAQESVQVSYSGASDSTNSGEFSPIIEESFTNSRTGEETFRLSHKR